MANLRGGVHSDRRGGSEATRLANEKIYVWANTWKRYVYVELYKDGEVYIYVTDDFNTKPKKILKVVLPPNEGENKDSFVPKIVYNGRDLTPKMIAEELCE